MPRDIEFNLDYADVTAPVATEEELLEFCNKVRAAGGATILKALLPSFKKHAEECLIANSLNFSCSIDANYDDPDKGYSIWQMTLPHNIEQERAESIAEAIGSAYNPYDKTIDLPDHIGNAAWAFDEGLAFQEFVE